MSVYVEAIIRAPLEELWRRTQDPREHQRWDLRFTEIEYLPRPETSQPQQFIYKTRIAGFSIAGRGETVGSREAATGERVLALRFWSDDPKSLIREGAGYWKYVPGENSVRFLTVYDYRVRYGLLGRFVDALILRPGMAWATAWSFDRLRLWIEKGIDPEISSRNSLVHWLARLAVALVWLYQGIVPKLYWIAPDELALLGDAGLTGDGARFALGVLGWLEIALAWRLLSTRRPARLFAFTIGLMVAATVATAFFSPRYLAAAFNPVSLNLLMAALAGVGWLSSRDLPAARRCRFGRSTPQLKG